MTVLVYNSKRFFGVDGKMFSIRFLSLIVSRSKPTKGEAAAIIWTSHQHRETNNLPRSHSQLDYLELPINLIGPMQSQGQPSNSSPQAPVAWVVVSVMGSCRKKQSHFSLIRQQTTNHHSHCGDHHHQSINGNERWHCIKSRLTLPLSCYQYTLQSGTHVTWLHLPPPVRLTPTALLARSPEGKI